MNTNLFDTTVFDVIEFAQFMVNVDLEKQLAQTENDIAIVSAKLKKETDSAVRLALRNNLDFLTRLAHATRANISMKKYLAKLEMDRFEREQNPLFFENEISMMEDEFEYMTVDGMMTL